MNNDQKEKLGERVRQFYMLELDGQPKFMHMGTSYLVSDLWSAVLILSDELNTRKAAHVSEPPLERWINVYPNNEITVHQSFDDARHFANENAIRVGVLLREAQP